MASTWPAKNNYATGDVLTAANMNGVGDDLNDVYNFSGYAAGKNKILNSDFSIWQRGTSFTPSSGNYLADRWSIYFDGAGATRTVSQQTFTPATAPVAGYEGTYFLRYNQSVAGSGGTYCDIEQRIEDVRTFAGQTVTFSFWAKADTTRTITVGLNQNFGSGGSATVYGTTQNAALTTSWQRFTLTFSVASVSGKTIGTSSFLAAVFNFPLNTTQTVDIWGVQLEAGSTASIFQTATGTKQGELAACQRYYFRYGGASLYESFAYGTAISTTQLSMDIKMPITMRSATSSTLDYSTLCVADGVNTPIAVTTAALSSASVNLYRLLVDVASGLTQYRWYRLLSNNSTSGYIGISAEL